MASRPFLRRALSLVLLAGGAIAPAAIYHAWRQGTAPSPPPIDLSRTEAPVARAVEAARGEVLRAPRSAEAWGHLGMVLLAHDFPEPAVECLREAEHADPANAAWPYLQAVTPGNPDPEVLLPALLRAVAVAGAAPVVRVRLGEVLLEAGRLDEAEAKFREALGKAPDDPRSHLGLAHVLRARGAWRESLAHLRASAGSSPNVRVTQALLAETYQRLGDPDAAESHRRLSAGAPDSVLWPDPYLEQVVRREIGSTALLQRAESFLQNERVDLALPLALALVQLHPARAEGHLLTWRLLTATGDQVGAQRALEEGVRLAPDSIQSLYYQGIDHGRRGRDTQAVVVLRRLTEREPQFAPGHCELGDALVRLGERAEAVRRYQTCLRYRPDLSRGHRALGVVLADMGRRDEAITHLEQADDLGGLTPAGRARLASLKGSAAAPAAAGSVRR